jgi:hypothetical protein
VSLFLSTAERGFITRERVCGVAARLFASMQSRVLRRAEAPGLFARGDTSEWWHLAEEAVADAAMIHALAPSPALAAWLRNVVMGIVRRPQRDWVGPWFRDHSRQPAEAQLETAHLTRSVAVAIDLAPHVLEASELDEARTCLRERAIPMALAHLERENQIHNHWCVITSGLAVAAAVVDDRSALVKAADAYRLYCQAYQPDGTYAECLQYANYASLNMLTTFEAIVRRDPGMRKRIPAIPYAGLATWAAYSYLYSKPLSGWGAEPLPRSINFGDSAAIFIPSAEVLLHIAAEAKETDPQAARLARWLFDAVVDAGPAAPPHDRASFGMVNRPGYLALPLLASATSAASPEQLELVPLRTFGCGDAIARDAWNGKTVVAMRTGGEPMHVVSHVHGDINSLIVVHNRERLLVDPGHSCYRSLVHELECSSHTHNTCTFEIPDEPAPRVQCGIANRRRTGADTLEPPLAPRSRLMLAAADQDVRVIVADAAGRYGSPITQFVRCTILCGAYVVFVIDRIIADVPVRARWNWLLNNRDGRGELEVFQPDRIRFRRGGAGLQLFSRAHAAFGGPQYAFVHDAYHPLPSQLGEGATGSGLLVHWMEREPARQRIGVHAIALDDYGCIGSWQCSGDIDDLALSGREGAIEWGVQVDQSGHAIRLSDRHGRRHWTINDTADGKWIFRQS